MRVHFLNSISTCPLGGALMDGFSYAKLRGRLTCTCVLIETADSLVLVDTGFGLRDIASPRTRLGWFFRFLVRPEWREEMTAIRQIERLGYDPRDVRHIILSHLDFDHAGGLDDFPHATVHMMQTERDYALSQKTWLDRQRFRPQQWSYREKWKVYNPDAGEGWYGFNSVRDLDGLPPEILFVPLSGHTHGHAGIAIQAGDKWLLNAADAYFYHKEIDPVSPCCTPGLRFYQTMLEKDRKARLSNQARLRQLHKHHAHEIDIFCSHDSHDFERLSGRSAELPASFFK
ncbi:MBL fold metallo-hydrolase [Acinetobacter sp. UBA1297]|uniref:MBL fold metallo-hydrolase n=1 Tax=Acinetobacter sp. UBA1297 TaxID=1945925 RepID=UPI00257D53C0|nr:MBL fold metallo-hydrolase [Acinetobacter sp. UBA1297]